MFKKVIIFPFLFLIFCGENPSNSNNPSVYNGQYFVPKIAVYDYFIEDGEEVLELEYSEILEDSFFVNIRSDSISYYYLWGNSLGHYRTDVSISNSSIDFLDDLQIDSLDDYDQYSGRFETIGDTLLFCIYFTYKNKRFTYGEKCIAYCLDIEETIPKDNWSDLDLESPYVDWAEFFF